MLLFSLFVVAGSSLVERGLSLQSRADLELASLLSAGTRRLSHGAWLCPVLLDAYCEPGPQLALGEKKRHLTDPSSALQRPVLSDFHS